jgi:hypothetical protein
VLSIFFSVYQVDDYQDIARNICLRCLLHPSLDPNPSTVLTVNHGVPHSGRREIKRKISGYIQEMLLIFVVKSVHPCAL